MHKNWLNDAEMLALRSYLGTFNELTTALDRDLDDVGLSFGEFQALSHLAEAPGRSMRMRDLADVLRLSPSGLTRRLDGLVRSSCVVRRASTSDRRVMNAVLTDVGMRKFRDAAPRHASSVRRLVFDRLDHQQIESLRTAFDAIQAGLADGRGRTASTPARTPG